MDTPRSQLLAQALASIGQPAPAAPSFQMPQTSPQAMNDQQTAWAQNKAKNALAGNAALPTGQFSQIGANLNHLGSQLGGMFRLGAGS